MSKSLEQVRKDIKLLIKEEQRIIESENKYIFKAGDVVECGDGFKRLIGRDLSGRFMVFGEDGHEKGAEPRTQDDFNFYKYKKVGELRDYIK